MSEEWVELGLTCRALVWSNDATVGRGIFMGCDNKLYLYKVEEDSYYYKGALDSGYNIKRLWVNASDSNNIYGAAWGEPLDYNKYLATSYLKIFKYDGTTFSTIDTISYVCTGEFCYRVGAYFSDISTEHWTIGYPHGSDLYCENLSLPFSQRITDLFSYGVANSIKTEASSSILMGYTSTLSSGYYAGISRLDGRGSNVRFSVGQYGAICLIPEVSTKGGIFLCTADYHTSSGKYYYEINYKIYDIATTTLCSIYTSVSDTLDEYEYDYETPYFPTCCTNISGEDSVIIGLVAWKELRGGALTPSRTYLKKISGLTKGAAATSPYSSVFTLYDSIQDQENYFPGTGDHRFRIFLNIAMASSSNLYVTFFNRDKNGTGESFGIGYHSSIVSRNTLDGVQNLFSVPSGLVVDSFGVSYLTSSDGVLHSYSILGETLTSCGDGNPFVDFESNIASNLISIPYSEINEIDTTRSRARDIIFGVSAPYFPNETQENPTTGKYYLWKYDNYLADRIELADFTDMSIWDAISKLTECAIDYSIGFDTDNEGSFFLTDKSSDTYTITLDISTDEVDKNLISIEKDRGLDEVFNYAEATPYVVTLSDISKELYVAPRNTTAEENKRVNVDDIYVDSTTHHNTSLRLICTKKGNVDESYTEMENNALFKWQLYETQIEAMVIGDVAAGATSVLVASTFRGGLSSTKTDINGNTIDYILDDAINLGDYITVVDPDTQTEETRRITAIADTTLTIDSAFSFDIASSTIVVITHPFDLTDTSVSWSDEGVTTLSADATNASTIYVTSIRDLSEYMVVSCEGDSPTFARISDIGDYDTDSSGYSLTLVGNTVTADAGAIVYAYYAPSKDSSSEYSYFDIGSTGIKLKISPESTSLNNEFWVGDRITITTEGLVSEVNEQSKQTAYNMTSMSERGRIEFPSIDNRFINRSLAKHIVRKIVNDYGDPHYIITINNTLYPTLRFIGDDNNLIRVRLYSKRMFPNYSEVILYPRSIQHNLKQGTTTIVGRDVTAY